jgi:hypothetical protein
MKWKVVSALDAAALEKQLQALSNATWEIYVVLGHPPGPYAIVAYRPGEATGARYGRS